MGDVIPVKPKTLKRTYKRHHYTVTFIPASKTWRWEVEVIPPPIKYHDTAATMEKAFRAAERCIDKCVVAQGKEHAM